MAMSMAMSVDVRMTIFVRDGDCDGVDDGDCRLVREMEMGVKMGMGMGMEHPAYKLHEFHRIPGSVEDHFHGPPSTPQTMSFSHPSISMVS